MTRDLTSRQQEVLDFIREKIVTRGYGPTVREIAETFNIRSPNGVMCHMRALERKGFIHRTANKSRAIELSEELQASIFSLPIIGKVSQKLVLESEVNSAELKKLQLNSFFKEGNFVVTILDESLVEMSKVYPGDCLILARTETAEVGTTVLVELPNGDTTFQQVSENSVTNKVVGVVIGVIRMQSKATRIE